VKPSALDALDIVIGLKSASTATVAANDCRLLSRGLASAEK
jgi:hypothetical protein